MDWGYSSSHRVHALKLSSNSSSTKKKKKREREKRRLLSLVGGKLAMATSRGAVTPADRSVFCQQALRRLCG
jgi:hypothetical protein